MNSLLDSQRMVIVCSASGLLTLFVCSFAESLSPLWNWVLTIAFFGGHFCLALSVARNRLAVESPIGRKWPDVIAVFGGFWLGPLIWFYEWKTTQSRNRLEPTYAERLPITTGRRIWIAFLLLILLVALLWFRLGVLKGV